MMEAAQAVTGTDSAVWVAVGTSAASFLAACGTMVASRTKGRHDKSARNENASVLTRIEQGVKAVQRDVGAVQLEVRDLRAYVIGPDGENGLRGDVRELKQDVRGVLERERERVPR